MFYRKKGKPPELIKTGLLSAAMLISLYHLPSNAAQKAVNSGEKAQYVDLYKYPIRHTLNAKNVQKKRSAQSRQPLNIVSSESEKLRSSLGLGSQYKLRPLREKSDRLGNRLLAINKCIEACRYGASKSLSIKMRNEK
jgi:hypothetical protein